MKKTGRVVTGICLLGTLCMGCYSTELIEPPAPKKNIYTAHIQYVVTKDGKRYDFEQPPTVINDTIVGGRATFTWRIQANEVETSFPHSDLAMVGQSPSGKTKYVVTKAGAKYTYEVTPAFVNGAYIGKATFEEYVPLILEQASIPLSDVAQVYVSRYNSSETWTLVGVGLTVAIVATTAAIVVADNFRLNFDWKK